ncbi:MAG TPA: glycosyl hydrolase family protein [Streptosporangiales bacterium]
MNGRRALRSLTAAAVAVATAAAMATGTGVARADEPATSAFSLTPTAAAQDAEITGDNQGFSVESADFAHGFLTRDLLANRLRTLGPHGVIRLGGYSMDLVWPAFGPYRDAPVPPQAIGGVVDQSDLDGLSALLDATGWDVTLGVPLKAVIDPSQVRSPTKDPSPPVTMDQAVAEVRAAYRTLGRHLLAVEVGNEYDNVTTLTPAQYYETLKRYRDAIHAAAPDAPVRMAGPSANTATTNTKLDDFVTALLADSSTTPPALLEELTSHYYPGSHCGSSTTSIPALMSTATYQKTRAKLRDIMSIDARLDRSVPMVINESNSASCSGQPGVSDAYATSLWSLDYLMQTAQTGVSRLEFHTNTAAICGDFKPRDSADYPISYRYYGAFCAADQAALDAHELSAAPLYYGIWAFRQVPAGRFVDLGLSDDDLSKLRAYGVESRDGKLTVVLINVQDPASSSSTGDAVTLRLPGSQGTAGSAVTLRSSAPGGLGSTDASAITLGGRTVGPDGIASGSPRHIRVEVGRDGSANVVVAPGTAQILTFPNVQVPGAVDVTGMAASQLLTAGRANPVTVSVANTTDAAQTVTAGVDVPEGWQAGSVSQTVPAHGTADISVPVTPPLAPDQATLTAAASAPGVPTAGNAGAAVVTAPPGDAVPLALDAGGATSEVYPGYQRLSPGDTWDAGKGYGWAGGTPGYRDRGGLDALRRDFALATTPATLRISVPAGVHEVYALRGDAGYSSGDTVVSEDGKVLADPGGVLSAGQFQWFHFPLDGGTTGRTADLTVSGTGGDYWRLVALTVQP